MKIKIDSFQVREGKKVNLKHWPTQVDPFYKSKEHYEELLKNQIQELSDYQYLQYALGQKALLLIFQGMDGSGKDSTIRHVMSGVNPQGCEVTSFKSPSATELKHDFLWRTTRELPPRGKIGIFNRSYYEEVLITRVHPELLEAEGVHKIKNEFWAKRYRSINDFEKHIHDNGTKVIKFYLHLSFEEQAKRFIGRIDDPSKNWKLDASDIKERKYWKDYLKAYEESISATSNEKSPWFIVPADDKPNARLIVSQILLETYKNLGMKMPKADAKKLKELNAIRKDLEASLK